jgi:GMP synthase (glutamine-hydrolysing)
LPYIYSDLYAGMAQPDPDRIEALVVMGGAMSANDSHPYLSSELDLLTQAFAAGTPVLGICLGAQLIAKALGARVYPNRIKEIGWYPIHWTDDAQSDPILHSLPSPSNIFQWHGDTFDLPAGATWLARSEGCPHQAFRAGANIYGFQFHLEVGPPVIDDWLRQDAACGELRELQTPFDPQAHTDEQRELAGLVFGRWAQRIVEIPR